MVSAKVVPNHFPRGVRVIIDKDHPSKDIMPDHFQPPEALPISAGAYLQVVNMFWFISLYIAKNCPVENCGWLKCGTMMPKDSFGKFNQVDSWDALLSTINLFQKLSEEVALKMQYSRPKELETYVSNWIKVKSESIN